MSISVFFMWFALFSIPAIWSNIVPKVSFPFLLFPFLLLSFIICMNISLFEHVLVYSFSLSVEYEIYKVKNVIFFGYTIPHIPALCLLAKYLLKKRINELMNSLAKGYCSYKYLLPFFFFFYIMTQLTDFPIIHFFLDFDDSFLIFSLFKTEKSCNKGRKKIEWEIYKDPPFTCWLQNPLWMAEFPQFTHQWFPLLLPLASFSYSQVCPKLLAKPPPIQRGINTVGHLEFSAHFTVTS